MNIEFFFGEFSVDHTLEAALLPLYDCKNETNKQTVIVY